MQQPPEVFEAWCQMKMSMFPNFQHLNISFKKSHALQKHGHQLFPEMIKELPLVFSILLQDAVPHSWRKRVTGHSVKEIQTGFSSTSKNLCYGLTGVADIEETEDGPIYNIVTLYPWRDDDRAN